MPDIVGTGTFLIAWVVACVFLLATIICYELLKRLLMHNSKGATLEDSSHPFDAGPYFEIGDIVRDKVTDTTGTVVTKSISLYDAHHWLTVEGSSAQNVAFCIEGPNTRFELVESREMQRTNQEFADQFAGISV